MKRRLASGWVLRSVLTSWFGLAGLSSCQAVHGNPDAPSPTPDAPSEMNTPEGPCQAAFGAACGAACLADDDCEAGLHCQASACAATCIQDQDCQLGHCSLRGRCEVDDAIELNPIETDPTPVDDAPICIEGQVEFKAVVPQVWLLLDRSSSMTGLLGATSRWNALGAVLLGEPGNPADQGVVGEFQSKVAFAAVFYTTGSSGTGCVLDLESVALAANNYRNILQRYNKIAPTGGTPTADSIAATVAVAATSDLTGGPKLLVLATDGEPGDCAPRPQAATLEVEGEVTRAFNKGIQTFAISIASGTDIPHMQRVANLGVGLAADTAMPAPVYTAESEAELKLAFSTILTDVPRSCVFSLNGRVEADGADRGSVTLAGQALAYGDPDGWTLKQADQVELVGDACTRVQAGEDDLDITFPCAVFTPVVK